MTSLTRAGTGRTLSISDGALLVKENLMDGIAVHGFSESGVMVGEFVLGVIWGFLLRFNSDMLSTVRFSIKEGEAS